MKVYVVTGSIPYESEWCCGVFSTPEKAAEAKKIAEQDRWAADYDIEEYTLDERQ